MKEFKLVKPRAKTEITFKEDKEEKDFIYIISNERKSGKQNSKYMIILKDLDDFLKGYYDRGWLKFDPDAVVEKKVKIKKVKEINGVKMPPKKNKNKKTI